jgi:hypothetical protein
MSEGSIYRHKGLLLHQRGGVILQMTEGVRWRLQLKEKVDHLIGEQVDVEGIRVDEGVLEVTRIKID